MPLSFNVKPQPTTQEEHSKGNFATGVIEFVLDGAVVCRLNKFHLRYSQQQNKYYIKAPARSVDGINPQTGQSEKKWFDLWEFFPGDRQVHDGWGSAIIQEIFRQRPNICNEVEQSAGTAPAGGYGQPQGYGQPAPGTYGAPQQPGPPMPGPQQQQQQQQQQAPQQHQQQVAPVPGGYGVPPAPTQAPQQAPPAGPPQGQWGPPAGGPPPGVPAAPGGPPMPSPGAPAFAPQASRPPAPPSPTANMPQSPSFPLP